MLYGGRRHNCCAVASIIIAVHWQAFDCLNDDFNYPLLILGMAGLAVATVVSSVLVKRKELHAAWA